MNKIALLLSVLLLTTSVLTAGGTPSPTYIFSGETTTVKFTFATAPSTSVTYKYKLTGGTVTNFGSCKQDTTVVTCTGVLITGTAQDIQVTDDDATTPVPIGTVGLKAANTLASFIPTSVNATKAETVTFTFGTEYNVAPVIKATNETAVDGSECAIDATIKTKVSCKFTLPKNGVYKITSNAWDTTKTLEAINAGSYLMLPSLIVLAFLF